VCAEDAMDSLEEEFRRESDREGRGVVYAAASESFAARCIARGYTAVEFGEEIVLDPKVDRSATNVSRELRKKIQRAEREGLSIFEHTRGGDAEVAAGIENVGRAWLAARHGPQAFVTPIDRLVPELWRRCFVAVQQGRVVGVVSLVRMDAKDGWAVQHLLHAPEAPVGTSEALVIHSLRVLGDEGAESVSFGTSPLARLGRMHGIGPIGTACARFIFDTAGRMFHLEHISRFREKFVVARRDPNFILFYPRFALLSTYGLLRTFGAH
jgi:lysylphosphatidylglycerol synthetase-like protein (DUF2156 family)